MMKTTIIILLGLLMLPACKNDAELVERFYKIQNGEEILQKEIFWENHNKKIKSKVVEYDLTGGAFIEIYSDSLLRTVYMIDNTKTIDTVFKLNYNYDKYGNIISYSRLEDGETMNFNIELVLDERTHKPISKILETEDGKSITKIEYSSNSEFTKTYSEGDSLILDIAKYFDKNNNQTSIARRHLMFTPSISDSTCFVYENGRLIHEQKFYNDSLLGRKDYTYEDEILTKIIERPLYGNEIIYIVKYSDK